MAVLGENKRIALVLEALAQALAETGSSTQSGLVMSERQIKSDMGGSDYSKFSCSTQTCLMCWSV